MVNVESEHINSHWKNALILGIKKYTLDKKSFDQGLAFYMQKKPVKFQIDRLSGFLVIMVTDLKKCSFQKNAFKVLSIDYTK